MATLFVHEKYIPRKAADVTVPGPAYLLWCARAGGLRSQGGGALRARESHRFKISPPGKILQVVRRSNHAVASSDAHPLARAWLDS